MATKGIEAIQVGPLLGLYSIPSIRDEEADTQDFKRGGPVKFSSGQIVEAGASSGSLMRIRAAASDPLLMIAEEDSANNTKNEEVGAVPALAGVIFEANMYDGTAPASAALTQDMVGTDYGLREHPTAENKWVIDRDQASASLKCVRVVGLKDKVGDIYGRVYFTIRAAWRLDA